MNGFFHSAYRFFPTEELTPRGWLRRQLEIQAEGLSGHLHEVWPDIRDSAGMLKAGSAFPTGSTVSFPWLTCSGMSA